MERFQTNKMKKEKMKTKNCNYINFVELLKDLTLVASGIMLASYFLTVTLSLGVPIYIWIILFAAVSFGLNSYLKSKA